MAVAGSFEDQITDLIGALPAGVADKGEKIMESAILDVINRISIINPSMLPLFATTTEFCPSEGVSLDNIKILYVTANNSSSNINCYQVPAALKDLVQKNSDSIYEATLNYPVYYIIDGKLYTAPQEDYEVTIVAETIGTAFKSGGALYNAKGSTPEVGDVFKVTSDQDFTGSELNSAKGTGDSPPADNDLFIVTNATSGSEAVAYISPSVVSEVVKGTISNYSAASSAISNFPSHMYHLPLLYTAYFLINNHIASLTADSNITTSLAAVNTSIAKFADVITNMDTGIDAGDTVLDGVSFTDFGTAIDKVSTIISEQTADWDSFVTAEDAEMAQTTLAGAQVRLGEASAELQKINAQIQQAAAYSNAAQGFALEADAITKEATANIGYVQTTLANISSDYNIYSAQAKTLWQQYEMAFVPYKAGN